MTVSQRSFDVAGALLAAALLAIPFLIVLVLQAVLTGRPLFYVSERMAAPDRAFTLWKLRTMRPDHVDTGVSGGDKADRVSPWGAVLRASRLDEVPQLWNVLRGDMRLVGPRPPLRAYLPMAVSRVPHVPPGLTGLATVAFYRHEARLLATCRTAAETDAVYCARCLPRKAKLDALHARNQSVQLDLLILFWTLVSLPRGKLRRLPRLRPNRHCPALQLARAVPRQAPA